MKKNQHEIQSDTFPEIKHKKRFQRMWPHCGKDQQTTNRFKKSDFCILSEQSLSSKQISNAGAFLWAIYIIFQPFM